LTGQTIRAQQKRKAKTGGSTAEGSEEKGEEKKNVPVECAPKKATTETQVLRKIQEKS